MVEKVSKNHEVFRSPQAVLQVILMQPAHPSSHLLIPTVSDVQNACEYTLINNRQTLVWFPTEQVIDIEAAADEDVVFGANDNNLTTGTKEFQTAVKNYLATYKGLRSSSKLSQIELS